MNQLEILRESLGQCDEIILDALIMRNRIVEDIMAYKEANGLQILQPEQEAKQKEWLEKRMEGRRHKDEVSDVFECIRTNSKRIQARKLFNYNIVLIGFMGAGKSTISDFLKNVFAMDVVEMDQIIAQRQGMSISDIFETYGEQYFRDLETNLLIEMQSRSNVVISCGGGTPMRECNVVEMKKNGRVVLLTAKPETILDRVKNNHDRPLIENNKTVPFIADLMEKRRAKYEAAADIIIETDGKNELEICEELVHRLRTMDEEKEYNMTDLVYDIRSAGYQVIILNVSVIIKRYGVSRLTGQSHIFLYSDILLCQISWSYNPIPSVPVRSHIS